MISSEVSKLLSLGNHHDEEEVNNNVILAPPRKQKDEQERQEEEGFHQQEQRGVDEKLFVVGCVQDQTRTLLSLEASVGSRSIPLWCVGREP